MKPDIHAYIRPGAHAHLVGIGGVSMSPLAEVLHGAGVKITGSDLHDSEAVEHLRSLGIPVVLGHRAESVRGAGVRHPHRRRPRRQPGNCRRPGRRDSGL